MGAPVGVTFFCGVNAVSLLFLVVRFLVFFAGVVFASLAVGVSVFSAVVFFVVLAFLVAAFFALVAILVVAFLVVDGLLVDFLLDVPFLMDFCWAGFLEAADAGAVMAATNLSLTALLKANLALLLGPSSTSIRTCKSKKTSVVECDALNCSRKMN